MQCLHFRLQSPISNCKAVLYETKAHERGLTKALARASSIARRARPSSHPSVILRHCLLYLFEHRGAVLLEPQAHDQGLGEAFDAGGIDDATGAQRQQRLITAAHQDRSRKCGGTVEGGVARGGNDGAHAVKENEWKECEK